MQSLTKRLSFLAIVMVLAIGTLGAAYTLWYEDLELHADVTTGELEGLITCGIIGDNDSGNFNWPLYPDPGKDIGSVTDGPINIHQWQIIAVNGYPGYAIDCELRIDNNGNVPWHIEWIDAVVHKDGAPLDLIYPFECEAPSIFTQGTCWAGRPTPGGVIPFWEDGTGDPIYFEIPDWRGCQLHGGEHLDTSFLYGINQSAMEGSTYSVWLKYRIHQWNESDWDFCGSLKDGATIPGPTPTPAPNP